MSHLRYIIFRWIILQSACLFIVIFTILAGITCTPLMAVMKLCIFLRVNTNDNHLWYS